MGSKSHQNHHRKAGEVVEEEVEEAMARAKAGGGGGEEFCGDEKIWMEGGGDDILLDIDGEDLIFTDDAFPSLPEFPCLSSPSSSPSPSSASNYVKPACPSSSSSSSSSSWSFLRFPGGGAMAQLQQPAVLLDASKISPPHDHHQTVMDSEGLDILGDFDLLDPSGAWEPSALFSNTHMMMEEAATPQQDQEALQHLAVEEELGSRDGGDGSAGDEESPCDDLAKVFLEWLKSNKDSISPEDLRSIRLKRSTIECAAHRLGGGKQGMMQLLKLILAWVQNHHLQKKRRQRSRGGEQELHDQDAGSPFPYQQQHQPFPSLQHRLPVLPDVPVNPNPSLDYNYDAESNFIACSSWAPHSPYPMDPATGAALPSLMMASYPADPNAAAPYHYHSSPSGSVVAAASQAFSPSSDFQAADPVSGWPPHFSTPAHYAPYPGASAAHPQPQYPGGFPNQYPGQPLYHQGQRLARLASATKEARKKRMARQRRFSSLHHHRSQKQHQQDQPQSLQQHSYSTALVELSSRPPSETHSIASHHNSTRNWALWSSLSSSSQKINPSVDAPPPPPNSSTMQQPAQQPLPSTMSLQLQNSHRNSSSSERRQGWKVEKNLRFLLQKVLKQSDVGSLGRIVLPKKEAEIHLPELEARDGISIAMEDIGTSRVWNMRYRFWPNNKSRMYLLENTGDFVRSNGLQEGDFIVIYSDVKCGKYMIRGVKVRQPPDPKGSSSKNAGQKRNSVEKSSTSKTRSSGNSNRDDDIKDRSPSASGYWDSSSSATQMDVGL